MKAQQLILSAIIYLSLTNCASIPNEQHDGASRIPSGTTSTMQAQQIPSAFQPVEFPVKRYQISLSATNFTIGMDGKLNNWESQPIALTGRTLQGPHGYALEIPGVALTRGKIIDLGDASQVSFDQINLMNGQLIMPTLAADTWGIWSNPANARIQQTQSMPNIEYLGYAEAPLHSNHVYLVWHKETSGNLSETVSKIQIESISNNLFVMRFQLLGAVPSADLQNEKKAALAKIPPLDKAPRSGDVILYDRRRPNGDEDDEWTSVDALTGVTGNAYRDQYCASVQYYARALEGFYGHTKLAKLPADAKIENSDLQSTLAPQEAVAIEVNATYLGWGYYKCTNGKYDNLAFVDKFKVIGLSSDERTIKIHWQNIVTSDGAPKMFERLFIPPKAENQDNVSKELGN